MIFGLILDAIADGANARDAIVDVVHTVSAVSPGSRLNLALTDGTTIVATACGDTLFTWQGDDAVIVASEPFDDAPGWSTVPDNALVVATRGDLSIGAIP